MAKIPHKLKSLWGIIGKFCVNTDRRSRFARGTGREKFYGRHTSSSKNVRKFQYSQWRVRKNERNSQVAKYSE
jgi:hypothetical protein